MSDVRILALVKTCRECPHRTYSSGGRYECREIRRPLDEQEARGIPWFCPLPRYPEAPPPRAAGGEG